MKPSRPCPQSARTGRCGCCAEVQLFWARTLPGSALAPVLLPDRACRGADIVRNQYVGGNHTKQALVGVLSALLLLPL